MKPIVAFVLSVTFSLLLAAGAWFTFLAPDLVTKSYLTDELGKFAEADSLRNVRSLADYQRELSDLKSYVQDSVLEHLTARLTAQTVQLSGLRLEYSELSGTAARLDSVQTGLDQRLSDSLGVFQKRLADQFSLYQGQLSQQMNQLTRSDAKIYARLDRAETFLERQVIPRLNTPLRFLGFDIFRGRSAKMPPLPELDQASLETEN